MDVRIATGSMGLFPGACRGMSHIQNGRIRPQAVTARAILAGVFGSNDTRCGSTAAAAPLVVVRFRSGGSEFKDNKRN